MTTLARVLLRTMKTVWTELQGIRLPLGLARDLWAASPLEVRVVPSPYQGGTSHA
jgi:hypothetical protein